MTSNQPESNPHSFQVEVQEQSLIGKKALVIESPSFIDLIGEFITEKGGQYSGLEETDINDKNLDSKISEIKGYDIVILHVSTYATYMLAKKCLEFKKGVIVLTRSFRGFMQIRGPQGEELNLNTLYQELEESGAKLLQKDYRSIDQRTGAQAYVVLLRQMLDEVAQ